MIIYTSSWFTYFGAGRISISRGTPRGMSAGYRIYRTLAPSRDILHNSADKAEYERRFYAEILNPLSPSKVIADLTKLAGDHPPVLLCYERPPFTETNFCHRHMVADWLKSTTGITVQEWSGVQDSNPQQSRLDV